MQAVFKNPKAFSFEIISDTASQAVFGFTERQAEILARGKQHKDEGSPLRKKVTPVMHQTLQTGEALLLMNTRALNTFSEFLNEIGKDAEGKGKDELEVRLLGWIRHCFTLATASAI